ncbi:MAG: carbohydrate binding family 9 domain-containing protein [Colwellia sp.]|nr:carbohydrate binding family 9 domain-containing protein [Colwellia sp.]
MILSLPSAAETTKKTNYKLVHDEQTIIVDGNLDEAVWQRATKMELAYENNPGEGVPASVKTEIYFYENGHSFNVAIKAYDPDPSQIRASLRDRDALWADDNVGIIIDTFNDERSGYEFFVNPLGAQADMRMDDSNGWDEDPSWDAIWESAGKITDFGYVVEISIPFSALRFPDTEGELTWNVAGWRNYPRDVRMQMATYKSDRNLECNLCQFDQLIGFKNVEAGNNFQLTPTLTISRADEKPEVPGPWQDGDVEVEPGLDVRWGITKDIVLNATINPDFSQVEADAGQLDVNSTYSLFYPEKRPFFLDGASYFDTSNFNFVHTRNIADPDFGAKVTGKTNKHSYGLMLANDNNTSFLLPGNQGSDIAELEEGSNIAIARYKVDVGERNNVGVLVTNRSTTDYNNTLVSIDGSYWFSKADSLTYQFAYADTQNPDSLVEEYEDDDNLSVKPEQTGNAMSLNYSHSTRDYSVRAGYTTVDEDFRADLGFQSQANYEKLVVGGNQTWYGDSNDTFTRWGYFGDWDITHDQNGKKLEQEIEIHGNLQGQKQFYTNFGIVHREKYYDGQYFDETQFKMFAKAVPLSGVELGTFFRFGKQIDYANTQLGDVLNIEIFTNYDVNKHLSIEFDYTYSHLDVDEGRLYTANLYDVGLSYQFDMYSIIKLIVQHVDVDRNADLYSYDDIEDRPDSISRNFSTQLIYSFKINPQTLFFIGYSDGGYQDDNLDSLTRDQRTVFTKFSYAWQL